jgi:hypothetical protein
MVLGIQVQEPTDPCPLTHIENSPSFRTLLPEKITPEVQSVRKKILEVLS